MSKYYKCMSALNVFLDVQENTVCCIVRRCENMIGVNMAIIYLL